MKTTPFKNTLFSFVLIIGMATVFAACRPEDGAVGPKGVQGENGPAGPAGDKGLNGSPLNKDGFITGTITGKGKDGVTPINETFRLEYTEDNGPVILYAADQSHSAVLARVDSSLISYSEIDLIISPDFSSAQFRSANLSLHKKVSEAQYKFLEGELNVSRYSNAAPGKITNFRYDAATGIATGDYVWTADNTDVTTTTDNYDSRTSTGQPFTVTGSFSFVARKGKY